MRTADEVPVARSVTDAEGRFRIELQHAGNVRFGVRAPGFASSERTIPQGDAVATDLGDVVLTPGIVLRGRVVDSAHAPVAGARVTRLDVDARPAIVLGSADAEASAVTDADGAFALADLAPGAWSLLVAADGHPDEMERGVAEIGRAPAVVEIVLDDGLEIRGRVVQAPPEAFTELWIRAVPDAGPAVGGLYAGDRVDPERFLVRPRGARCGADGAFVVRGLTRGLDYRLVGRAGENDFFGAALTGQVTARAGASDVELVYRGVTALAFQVVDGATSKPVTELEVRVGPRT